MIDLKVYYEDNHLLVVEKPENMPTCLDESNDYDLLSLCKDYIKEKYNKPGNVYLGLVHRLDRPVGGIMVFAKTSKAASRLSLAITNKKFQKEYLAVVEDNNLPDKDILSGACQLQNNGLHTFHRPDSILSAYEAIPFFCIVPPFQYLNLL